MEGLFLFIAEKGDCDGDRSTKRFVPAGKENDFKRCYLARASG